MHLSPSKFRLFTALLNRYCLEFSNWGLYAGAPVHDAGLAAAIKASGYNLFLRIDFTHKNIEAFIPLHYYSATGQHIYQSGAFMRSMNGAPMHDFTYEMLQVCIDQELTTCTLKNHEYQFEEKHDDYPVTCFTREKNVQLKPGELIAIIAKYAYSAKSTLANAAAEWFSAYLRLGISFWLDEKGGNNCLPSHFAVLMNNNFPIGFSNIAPKQLFRGAYSPACWVQRFLFKHVFPIVGHLGNYTGADEQELLSALQNAIKDAAKTAPELCAYILNSRKFVQPGELGLVTYTCHLYNPLHQTNQVPSVLQPQPATVYDKKNEAGLHIRIRPVCITQDLPMLHDWFNRAHAKAIWQMDWPLSKLEHFYRCLLPGPFSHSFIGEIEGVPCFNVEVYWATRDVLGDYYDVQPGDYGTHLFIAPLEKNRKHPLLTMQTIMDWLFLQPQITRLVGEGSVNSLPALMNKVQAGFRLEKVIELPHKKAHLNFCIRDWYYEKFPHKKPTAHRHLNLHPTS